MTHSQSGQIIATVALAVVTIACRAKAEHTDSEGVISSAVAARGDAAKGNTGRRRYTLLRMGGSSVPFEESGYTVDCSRITLSGTFELEGGTWSQRDSARHRCPSTNPPDSVETFEGTVRFAGDTLHLDVLHGQQPMEAEIARISGDTLKTGLGISGSTPRLYVRIDRLHPDSR